MLAEVVPRHTQRLYQLVDLSSLPGHLTERVIAAEEAIYAVPDDPMVNWESADLQAWFTGAGMTNLELIVENSRDSRQITTQQVNRWFNRSSVGGRLTYAEHLLNAGILLSELEELQDLFQRQLLNQNVFWQFTTIYLVKRNDA